MKINFATNARIQNQNQKSQKLSLNFEIQLINLIIREPACGRQVRGNFFKIIKLNEIINSKI